MDETTKWISPLGASVIMLLLIGFLWILIGALTVAMHDRQTGRGTLFTSGRADKAYFGRDFRQLMASEPALAKLRTLLLTVIAGFLLLLGVVFVSLAWFGVRNGHSWAVITLGLGGNVAVFFWGLALLPYVQAKISLTLIDLPPFIWIPSLLILPVSLLGWIGVAFAR